MESDDHYINFTTHFLVQTRVKIRAKLNYPGAMRKQSHFEKNTRLILQIICALMSARLQEATVRKWLCFLLLFVKLLCSQMCIFMIQLRKFQWFFMLTYSHLAMLRGSSSVFSNWLWQSILQLEDTSVQQFSKKDKASKEQIRLLDD